ELVVRDIAPPPLRPGSVRIKVAAAGVSFATQLVVSGRYQRKPPLPFSPGTDAVGTVLETAAGVAGLARGTPVFAALDWSGCAEEAVVDAIHVMPVPPALDLISAVALPHSYSTAAGAFLWRRPLQPGDWVLVHGAGGGVGLAAVEIGRALGARVIARAGAAKHAALRARGAEVVLDSAVPFRDAVRQVSGGGVQVVFDSLGGDVFDESLRCLAEGGTLLTIGYAAGGIPHLPLNLLLLKNIGVAGFNWGTYVGWAPGDNRETYAPQVRALWRRLLEWWQAGQIAPTVQARFPLQDFRAAMAAVRERSVLGRVVLLPGA
ncbi:MAG TPA: zinc-binding dehydrogenase, partial [Candidatus Sulfotelmatobacter sp.]|nr:zinc-binding dehydrogenase [Candidatus Sulfotelmatobacter sp.]